MIDKNNLAMIGAAVAIVGAALLYRQSRPWSGSTEEMPAQPKPETLTDYAKRMGAAGGKKSGEARRKKRNVVPPSADLGGDRPGKNVAGEAASNPA